MLTAASPPSPSTSAANGLRPVNLRTDLGPLADLMELVFAESMDQGGAAAVREMRALSRMGAGIGLLPGMNDLLQGIRLGYVWIEEGKLVGNVSVYPARWPGSHGKAWIIANVGVHPDYQRRGIATQLIHASQEMIRREAGRVALLQVDAENDPARRIYQRLGFVDERAWTLWRRSSAARIPASAPGQTAQIARRRPNEWQAEFALAKRLRPAEKGGLGWQRPLHREYFHKPFWRQIGDWLNMRGMERLVIRSEDEQELLAVLWIESAFLTTSTQLTLMVAPEYQGVYDDLLLRYITRRYDMRGSLLVEHPTDETVTASVLQKYHFRPQREVIHMRWDV